MHYVVRGEDGEAVAFYDDRVHQSKMLANGRVNKFYDKVPESARIPEGAEPITEAEYETYWRAHGARQGVER